MRHQYWIGAAVVMGIISAATSAHAQAAGSEEKAKAAFLELVKRCSDAYGQKRPERIRELPGGGFLRAGAAEAKLSYDITRTQSLVSPLTGVVTAELTALSTRTRNTKEEAEAAPLEPAILVKDTLSFAFQDGVWVYRSIRSESFPIEAGVLGRADMVLTTDPKRGNGPTPSSAYVCAFGDK